MRVRKLPRSCHAPAMVQRRNCLPHVERSDHGLHGLGLISGTDKVRVEIKGFERWAVEVEVAERVDYLDSDGEMYRG